jgi:hypothetical protein
VTVSARLTTLITSPPDRDQLVVEVWNGDVQLAELSRSPAGVLIEFYGHPSGGGQLVELEELRRVLDVGVRELNQLRDHGGQEAP